MQQQNQNPDWRQSTNAAYNVASWYQRALIVPFRKGWGTEALGFPCLGGFCLMFVWYVATGDFGLLVWMGFWLLWQVVRRVEAVKLAGHVHSRYDGFPVNLGSDERLAKRWYEPICIGVLGGIAYWFYTLNGLDVRGLPYFLLGGMVSLPFVASVDQTLWKRRLQGMADAKIEQEMLVDDFKNRG